MAKITAELYVPRLKMYVKENLGALFIIIFQIFLVVCACFLFQKDLTMASEVAVCAYYLLVMGVVLQLFSFIRRRKDKEISK